VYALTGGAFAESWRMLVIVSELLDQNKPVLQWTRGLDAEENLYKIERTKGEFWSETVDGDGLTTAAGGP